MPLLRNNGHSLEPELTMTLDPRLIAVVTGLVSVSAACTVSLSHQLSSSSCTGKFGCSGSDTMWVADGCRGYFTCNGASNVKCDPCDPSPCRGVKNHTCMCVPSPPPPPAPKYMLLDDRNVINTDASFVLGEVDKHPSPLITEEREYEMRFDNMQPNVWYDPVEQPGRKKWRAWYSAFTTCSKPKDQVPFCNNAPQKCGTTNAQGGHRGSGFLYAESDDGINWVKPSLGLQEWKGSTENNLIKLDLGKGDGALGKGDGGMTTGIYLDESTTNSSERYKISTGSNGAGAIAVSPDGIHWDQEVNLESETHARWDTPKVMIGSLIS